MPRKFSEREIERGRVILMENSSRIRLSACSEPEKVCYAKK
jgi:hypothetical protein